ncbi:MAG: NAD(P)-dependent alcohol dehydrogenase [Sciscionella sp.]
MIPETMRAAVLHGVGDIRIEERRVPEPAAGEVLVRIAAVGTCGSDTHYFTDGRIGNRVVTGPLVLGHEASGTVAALGVGAHRHRVGGRVSLEPGVPCAQCAQCRSGRYNLCPEMRFFATPPIDGAFCEYVVLNESFAHPIPANVSDEAAALLEPLSVGIWACRKAGVGPQSRVLITGAGPIGLIALQTARACGARQIVISDVNRARLEMASALGAASLVDAGERALHEVDMPIPDVLIECSGVPAVITEAIGVLGPAARAVCVGMGGDQVVLPLAHLQTNEIQLSGTYRYANTWPAAIALASSRAVDLERLVSHRFDLDHVADALTLSQRNPQAIKSVVRVDCAVPAG